ncbi:MAG: 16S rRNA (cytosine(1402)-N(4))-methyltransferase RsmH [Sphingomonas sp.]|uniref:16S rRNA (cytosine(1402)-N(4))-methyltransferase RsmH n=1 Tax=Sphingomonas sp. TaxID=28214 RepID=UPI0025EAFC33|nr:16S rRNA (cytosine(1402)-N(4))-methyltransferase RsmH [Sphingomonas sp.]MBY0284839.1 16S rRNA (cytosine(1402)-N(4))-methyltransferase RsmH [Sphingomonas sp.]
MTDAPHIPVLLAEVTEGLDVAPGSRQVDATFGAGGYTRALLGAGAEVIAFDRDPDAIAAGQALVAEADGRLTLIHAVFSSMGAEIEARGLAPVDGLTMDIGVSSMQLDQAKRGFAAQADAVPDMRMSQEGETAAEFLNTADEEAIADVLYHYGEEPRSRRVARAIVAARPIDSTLQLATVVRRALGHKPHDKKDPAMRLFQAIRIHLNRELDELAQGLVAAERLLRPGGRLAVVTFHSLEDRVVKQFLRTRSGAQPGGSRHLPQAATGPAPSFETIGRAVRASDSEIARNPRARSATLRVAQRTAAAAWQEGAGQ